MERESRTMTVKIEMGPVVRSDRLSARCKGCVLDHDPARGEPGRDEKCEYCSKPATCFVWVVTQNRGY